MHVLGRGSSRELGIEPTLCTCCRTDRRYGKPAIAIILHWRVQRAHLLSTALRSVFAVVADLWRFSHWCRAEGNR